MNIRRQNGNFHFEEDIFSKNFKGTGKIFHKLLILIKSLQTKQQVKSMNVKKHDLYYTVI